MSAPVETPGKEPAPELAVEYKVDDGLDLNAAHVALGGVEVQGYAAPHFVGRTHHQRVLAGVGLESIYPPKDRYILSHPSVVPIDDVDGLDDHLRCSHGSDLIRSDQTVAEAAIL